MPFWVLTRLSHHPPLSLFFSFSSSSVPFLISLYKSKESLSLCASVCLCMCASNISTWLLRGSRVCYVLTTMILLINYFINALRIPLALSTIATIVTCAPEPITAELTSMTYLKKQADLYLQQRELDRDFASGSVPFCASKLTVVD